MNVAILPLDKMIELDLSMKRKLDSFNPRFGYYQEVILFEFQYF